MTRGFEFISLKQIENDFGEAAKNLELKLPKRATAGSAGYDCYAPFDITLDVGKDIKVPTGLRANMRDGEALLIFPRSGLGFKYYTRLANTIGLVDSDYVLSNNEGHIFVKLRNEGDKPVTIKMGEAMCQFVFIPYLLADGDDYTGEVRNGGFGSTDK